MGEKWQFSVSGGSNRLSSAVQQATDRTADEGAMLCLFMPFPFEGVREGLYLSFPGAPRLAKPKVPQNERNLDSPTKSRILNLPITSIH